VVKFVFAHSKLRKQPLFAESFKIKGGQNHPMLSPSDTHAPTLVY